MIIAGPIRMSNDEKEKFDFENTTHKYDGSGNSVYIPTFIMTSASDSYYLIDLLHEKTNFDERVVLNADIEISNAVS